MKAAPLPERCRKPACPRAAEVRGVCRSCFHAAWSLVEEGKVTWEQLEKAGKIAPRKRNAKEWMLEGIRR